MNDTRLEIILAAKDMTERTFRAFQGRVNALTKSVFSLRGGLLSLAGGYTIRSIGEEFLDTGISAEKMRLSLEAATGSIEAAAQEEAFLRQESERLGLVFQQQIKDYASLAAAAKGTNLEGQATREIYLGLVEAGTALQMSQDDLSGALRAVQQMMSKGKVQAEELRGQLGERLPGAFQIAARAMGVTTAELSKMLERGEVFADDFLPKFAKALREKFADNIAGSSDSAQANINRLKNTWFELKDTIMSGGLLDELNTQIKNVNNELSDWIANNRELIQQKVQESIESIKNAVKDIYDLYKSLPDEIVGAAGMGLVGKMLFGNTAGGIIAFMSFLKAQLDDIAKRISNKVGVKYTGIIDVFKQIGGKQQEVLQLKPPPLRPEDWITIHPLKNAADESKKISGQLIADMEGISDKYNFAINEINGIAERTYREIMDRHAAVYRQMALLSDDFFAGMKYGYEDLLDYQYTWAQAGYDSVNTFTHQSAQAFKSNFTNESKSI